MRSCVPFAVWKYLYSVSRVYCAGPSFASLGIVPQGIVPSNGVSSSVTNGSSSSDVPGALTALQAAGFPEAIPVALAREDRDTAKAAVQGNGDAPSKAASSNRSSSFNAREGRKKWASFRHVCGVAIYQEEEEVLPGIMPTL